MSDDNSYDIISEDSVYDSPDVTPKDLLQFAKSILSVISILFVFGGITEFIHPVSGIFEACKTILPPIATLVIGFYFGKSK